MTSSTIAVAGASGFVGQAIGAQLGDHHQLIGISRSKRNPGGGYSAFRQADLFSLSDCEAALEDVDYAIYLVHSMLPSARLVQGHFADLDLLCADNFARAAKKAGVRQIIYLGGLLPTEEAISNHLRSREEVERALAATGVPVTTLRAGLVVGAQGSSFQMLLRLVERLPMMVCPKWTQTRMQPVALSDVVKAIELVCGNAEHNNKTYDLGCPDVVSYRELMAATAEALGVQRRFISVPFLSPKLSRLWVTLTTGAPKELVAPLVASLTYEMTARPDYALHELTPLSLTDMLEKAVDQSEIKRTKPRAYKKPAKTKNDQTVRSVQRMTLPAGRDAEWATLEYLKWLPGGVSGLIRVERNSDTDMCFRLLKRGPVLLTLTLMEQRSEASRTVLRVTGGLLARETRRGRLEFRQVLDESTLIAAVHDFVPRLPWWIYLGSQAPFHRYVMYRFGRHLGSQNAGRD